MSKNSAGHSHSLESIIEPELYITARRSFAKAPPPGRGALQVSAQLHFGGGLPQELIAAALAGGADWWSHARNRPLTGLAAVLLGNTELSSALEDTRRCSDSTPLSTDRRSVVGLRSRP